MKLPLHNQWGTLDILAHWANMSSLNPKGFRELSKKKNRHRRKTDNPKKYGTNGRFLSRPEQLALDLSE